MEKIKIIQTEDGSHSLFLPDLKETYHSFHGAIRESIYVYINQGFHYLLKKELLKKLHILEIGFGTGLNILLTFAEAEKNSIATSITTLEPFPLPEEIWKNLNYPEALSSIYKEFNFQIYMEVLHNSEFEKVVQLTDHSKFIKKNVRVQEIMEPIETFYIIYFDAFAPSRQPEMWKTEIFEKLYQLLIPGGILVTYCAQGQFKRNLKDAGFLVETLQGPPGKKEMIRGIKPK